MEDDFQILFDYLKNVRELAEKDKADSAENSPGDEEKKCVHEAIQTGGSLCLLQMWSCARGHLPTRHSLV